MDSTEKTERNHADAERHRLNRDPASNRPMSITEIQSAYAEYADWLHRFERLDRLLTGRYREARFGDLDGRVLDVACGTGTNVRYLPESTEIVGIDVSAEMLEKAAERLARRDHGGSVHQMDAQDLDFEDDSFDAVISSMSTCTFPDPVAALQEMERVCKPTGTIRLVEHGRSDVDIIGRFQDWRADAHYAKMGCRWNQDPHDVVEQAGLPVQDSTSGLFGVITAFELDPREVGQR